MVFGRAMSIATVNDAFAAKAVFIFHANGLKGKRKARHKCYIVKRGGCAIHGAQALMINT
jgi:hypothetical protein